MIEPKIQTLADWAVADELLTQANTEYFEEGELEMAISRIKAANLLIEDVAHELGEQSWAARNGQ